MYRGKYCGTPQLQLQLGHVQRTLQYFASHVNSIELCVGGGRGGGGGHLDREVAEHHEQQHDHASAVQPVLAVYQDGVQLCAGEDPQRLRKLLLALQSMSHYGSERTPQVSSWAGLDRPPRHLEGGPQGFWPQMLLTPLTHEKRNDALCCDAFTVGLLHFCTAVLCVTQSGQ